MCRDSLKKISDEFCTLGLYNGRRWLLLPLLVLLVATTIATITAIIAATATIILLISLPLLLYRKCDTEWVTCAPISPEEWSCLKGRDQQCS
jgi:TRAP-type mannitol/chloroaromatic compound transport system permease large subunit